MTLPIEWVEKIFKKLSLTYGRDFLGRYEGVPIEEVKADWAKELGCMSEHPLCIKHALQNLPASKAPTVYEFRHACTTAPKMIAPALPRPAQDPAVVAAVAAGIKRSATGSPHGMKEWAYRLKARHEQGDRLNPYQVACYRTALGIVKPETVAA